MPRPIIGQGMMNGNMAKKMPAAVCSPKMLPNRRRARDRMRAICWLRAGWTYIRGQRKFADDVLGRKLLIVEGASKFRGSWVDLDEKYGVSDEVIGC